MTRDSSQDTVRTKSRDPAGLIQDRRSELEPPTSNDIFGFQNDDENRVLRVRGLPTGVHQLPLGFADSSFRCSVRLMLQNEPGESAEVAPCWGVIALG